MRRLSFLSDRLMLVMRSAERVDRILGDDWTSTEMPFGKVRIRKREKERGRERERKREKERK